MEIDNRKTVGNENISASEDSEEDVRARGWEKSLRKHGKITMKYRATRPSQHVVTISVEAKTSVF